VRRADAQRLLDLLADCAAAEDGHAFRSVLVEGVAGVFGSEFASYQEFDFRKGEHVYLVEPAGALQPALLEEIYAHAGESPMVAHWWRSGGEPTKESDFLSQRSWRRLGIGSLQRQAGAEDTFGLAFFQNARADALALHDAWGRFGERERTLLDLLRSPLIRVRGALDERVHSRELLARALAASGPVVLADTLGRVELASPAAHELLAHYSVTILHDGALAARNGTELVAIKVDDADGVATVVLEERRRPNPALTRREHEVLVLVRDGLTNPEIADSLTISVRTVERHLQNLYDKLDVRTRTAAVARAFGGGTGAPA
jgi:ATP/maltotriose-dependent transcriptional regulator MalT